MKEVKTAEFTNAVQVFLLSSSMVVVFFMKGCLLENAQGLLLALHLIITLGGFRWPCKDWTWIIHMQDKWPASCTMLLEQLFFSEKLQLIPYSVALIYWTITLYMRALHYWDIEKFTWIGLYGTHLSFIRKAQLGPGR